MQNFTRIGQLGAELQGSRYKSYKDNWPVTHEYIIFFSFLCVMWSKDDVCQMLDMFFYVKFEQKLSLFDELSRAISVPDCHYTMFKCYLIYCELNRDIKFAFGLFDSELYEFLRA